MGRELGSISMRLYSGNLAFQVLFVLLTLRVLQRNDFLFLNFIQVFLFVFAYPCWKVTPILYFKLWNFRKKPGVHFIRSLQKQVSFGRADGGLCLSCRLAATCSSHKNLWLFSCHNFRFAFWGGGLKMSDLSIIYFIRCQMVALLAREWVKINGGDRGNSADSDP